MVSFWVSLGDPTLLGGFGVALELAEGCFLLDGDPVWAGFEEQFCIFSARAAFCSIAVPFGPVWKNNSLYFGPGIGCIGLH